ncbi:MAG: OmpA family protein [Spirochaetales bacterium]|nr:OmpA family protein [Spirochaetales bacterium]
MKKKRLFVELLVILRAWGGVAAPLSAVDLRFLYRQGDQFRIYGVSNQDVFVNGKKVEHNLDTYRISFKITETTPNSGHLVGETLYTSQRSDGLAAAKVDEAYPTDFWRDDLGHCRVPEKEILPVVRNVPTFAGKDVQPGDTWAAPGEELEDLSEIRMFDSNGVPMPPLRVPVQVSYKYLGEVQKDGKTLQLIQADYELFLKTPFSADQYKVYPMFLTGYSHQKIWFDEALGLENSYEENYSLVLTLNNGDVFEFTGDSHSKLVEAKVMDKPKIVDEVKKSLAEQGLGNLQVQAAPKGVMINLDNIQFPPDSALLLPSEKQKLSTIGAILKKYPKRDILVEGFTALAGTAEDRLKLSQDRAQAVGDYLVQIGVRQPSQITCRGWGAEKPLAPNDNEADMQKNRRVEITLLEN